MFVTHFGLRRRPFRTSPDTDSYYPATTHELALHELETAVLAGEALCLLRGATGMGKTLVVRRLLEQQEDASIRPVLIANTKLGSARDLLQGILYEFGVPYQNLTEQEARLAVTEECFKHFQQGGRTLLVIDEAQHLNEHCLEELRLLGNLAANRGPAVQVVLSALPALWGRIDQRGMESLLQRLAVRPELHPLDETESMDYVVHQLRWAGAKNPEKLFDGESLNFLTRHANGVPRLLNQLSGAALQLAAENGLERVDFEAVTEALGLLGLLEEEELEAVETLRIHREMEAKNAAAPAPAPAATAPPAPPTPAAASKEAKTLEPVAVEDLSTPFAETVPDFQLGGKRIVYPPIVITDTYPPKFIYDGDEWVRDPLGARATT